MGMDQEGRDFTATPCYERLIASTTFMAEQLNYHSEGSISQADLGTPDALNFERPVRIKCSKCSAGIQDRPQE